MEGHEPGRSTNGAPLGATVRTLITSPSGSAVAVGTAAAIVFVWMRLAVPSASPDAWAYSAWGQAIARGEPPVYELSATTPKPLATALGAITSPFPAPNGIAVIVALALAIAIGGIFFIGFREAGAVGAVIPLAAFLSVTEITTSFRASHIDIVVAALVVLGVALKRFARVASWGLAGLLRPEAWVLTALGGFLAVNGSWRRKLAVAVGVGVLPVVLWALWDLVTAGDPLATIHWRENRRALLRSVRPPVEGEFPPFMARWVADEPARVLVVLLGIVGLFAASFQARKEDRLDKSIPLIVAVAWFTALTVERHFGQGRFLPRYILPSMAMIAVGTGVLARPLSRYLPITATSTAATAVALLIVGLFAASLHLPSQSTSGAYNVLNAGLDEALECGRVAVVGDERTPNTIVQLAAASREPASKFEFVFATGTSKPAEIGKDIRGVLRRPGANAPLPQWKRRVKTDYGILAIAPRCRDRMREGERVGQ